MKPVPAQRNTSAASRFIVREATADDREVLARHRCEMFSDMGSLRHDAYPELARLSADYFAEAIPHGDYVAWLVEPADEPGTVVAGGGVQLRQILPRPDVEGGVQPPGLQGLIVNVYTEKAWRRRGLAELVMRRIISWSREHGVVGLVLHASTEGRPLYERLGFLESNEMYYAPLYTGEDDPR